MGFSLSSVTRRFLTCNLKNESFISSRLSIASSVELINRNYCTYSQLPEEHKMIYESCRKFADEQLAPHAKTWDKNHIFPKQAIEKLAELGIMGLNVGEE